MKKPMGIWFNIGNLYPMGWVARAPGQSSHGGLPDITYLGGERMDGHIDDDPLVLESSFAQILARKLTSKHAGMYEARELPNILVFGFKVSVRDSDE